MKELCSKLIWSEFSFKFYSYLFLLECFIVYFLVVVMLLLWYQCCFLLSFGLNVSICFFKQSIDELIRLAHEYYDEVALPKLVIFFLYSEFCYVLRFTMVICGVMN